MQTVVETPNGWMVRCLNCGWHQYPKVGKPGASWKFDGDLVKPTFTPSMNETVGPFPEKSQWAGQIHRCHFTVTGGMIQFHADCTHDSAGQTMPLEPWDQGTIDYYAALLRESPS